MHIDATEFDALYAELKRLARRVRRSQGSATLNTTGLVHEAFLKLGWSTLAQLDDHAHRLNLAARAMRQVLVDFARRKLAAKRDGGIAVEHEAVAAEAMWLIELDSALVKLPERQAHVVVCRFFGGLTEDETARALQVSTRTVQLDWQHAREELARLLG